MNNCGTDCVYNNFSSSIRGLLQEFVCFYLLMASWKSKLLALLSLCDCWRKICSGSRSDETKRFLWIVTKTVTIGLHQCAEELAGLYKYIASLVEKNFLVGINNNCSWFLCGYIIRGSSSGLGHYNNCVSRNQNRESESGGLRKCRSWTRRLQTPPA